MTHRRSLLAFTLLILLLSACATSAAPTSQPTLQTTALPTGRPTDQPIIRPTRAPTPTPSQRAIQTPAWFNDVVLYLLMPRSFYDSNGDSIGDLKGITQKLDYLKALGIGAIWLTPIFAASDDHHGYHTVDYYKVNPDYGTEADLVALVREAHRRSIRVLLDYVVAHTSNQHPFFKDAFANPASKYASWYRWTNAEHTSYESFFGLKELPILNHDNPDVQQYLLDVAKYWMKTADIDGYRCDYVLNVPHTFWKRLRAELKPIRSDFLLLAEAWTKLPDLAPYYNDEFDATFDFPVYGEIEHDPNAVGDSLLLGNGSPNFMDINLAAGQTLFPPGAQRVEFLNNHDTERVMSEVKGDLQRARLGADLLLTLPGTPQIYYGEEIGMAGTKSPAPDFDKTRREPMDWYAAESGPGMTSWFKPPNRNNRPNDGISVEEEQGKRGSLLEHYRALIALRNANRSLRTGIRERMSVDNPGVYAYLRYDEQSAFVIALNFGAAPAALTLDLSNTSLPDGRYTATDVLSKKTFEVDALKLSLKADAATGYVLQLTRR